MIDADALMERIKSRYCVRCDNYNGIMCRACPTDDALCMIDESPTIPAIPVEWLEEQRDKRRAAAAAHSNISSMTVLEAINVVLELWQKEQEAR